MGHAAVEVRIVIFRERKVGHSKTSRLLVDENDWDNCRPCREENKVTTTSRDQRTL